MPRKRNRATVESHVKITVLHIFFEHLIGQSVLGTKKKKKKKLKERKKKKKKNKKATVY